MLRAIFFDLDTTLADRDAVFRRYWEQAAEQRVPDLPDTAAAEMVRAPITRGAGARGIVCSDRGTGYGADGYCGHRVSHPVVWNVPYAEFVLEDRR